MNTELVVYMLERDQMMNLYFNYEIQQVKVIIVEGQTIISSEIYGNPNYLELLTQILYDYQLGCYKMHRWIDENYSKQIFYARDDKISSILYDLLNEVS